ncbi:LexA family transcriptional regulator [Agrobacterium rosae]|uniref:LexA family transcriptional regulator n=1 Tax=Agrobacterium rosae TaxID=1972867 RepID=UPI002A128319|nr:LexA family transcriptional regulator [Agrobacterium rosae]MDX8315619.1 LexA family transcriptional regulator [Agrobacterium rosae]
MSKNWLDPFIKASKIGSQEALADALDLSRATINRLANDHSLLKRDRAEKIAALLGARVEDLMLNRPPSKPSLISSFDPDESDQPPSQETFGYSREHWKPSVDGALPEVNVKLGAGSGVVGETINIPVGRESVSGHAVVAEWLIPLQYLRNETKASPNHTLVMEVIGDSMQPTYMPGDRVLVDLSQTSMSSDTVYAISDGQSEPQIKRLQRVPFSDPVEVRIISDNPNLERFTVELDRLTILGRIVGHIARK